MTYLVDAEAGRLLRAAARELDVRCLEFIDGGVFDGYQSIWRAAAHAIDSYSPSIAAWNDLLHVAMSAELDGDLADKRFLFGVPTKPVY